MITDWFLGYSGKLILTAKLHTAAPGLVRSILMASEQGFQAGDSGIITKQIFQ
jgi:hypothetical protein